MSNEHYPREMSPEEVLTMVVVIGFVCFVLVPILAEQPDKNWVHYIHEFQTLIAGVFAVLAAYITVKTMMAIDKKQAARHDQILAFEMQRDALAVTNFMDFFASDLRRVNASLEAYTALLPDDALEPIWKPDAQKAAREMAYAVWRIGQALDDERLNNCRPLFTPAVYRTMEDFQFWVRSINSTFGDDALQEIYVARPAENAKPNWFEKGMEIAFVNAAEAGKKLAIELESWGIAFLRQHPSLRHIASSSPDQS